MATTTFGVPSELDNEALEKALADAHSHGAELSKISDEDFTDEKIDELSSVAEFITNAKAEQAARAQAAAERSEKLAALRNEVVIKKKDDDDKDSEVEEPEEAIEVDDENEDEVKKKKNLPFASETETAASETETASDEPVETSQEEAPAETEEESPAGETEEEASDSAEEIPSAEDTDTEKEGTEVSDHEKASLGKAAKNAPEATPVEEASNFSLTAAANVNGVNAGKSYDNIASAGEAILASAKSLPTGRGAQARKPALNFAIDSQFAQGPTGNDTELLLKAGSESRLEGKSVVAAGGWAAPSEQLLDFCDIEKADGLLDLPGITVNRGGVNYTKGPSFDNVLNSSTGFWDMTEAQAEAGSVEKTSLRPATPTFNDVRLDAVGVMVEAGLLTRHGWPELVERYAKLAVLAHRVKVHKKLLKGITDYTGSAVNLAGGYGNATDVLHVLDAIIAGERQRFSMGNTGTVESLVPFWIKNILRADLANRNGVDLLDVSDARINSWFTARGARPQYLFHWQELQYTNGVVQGYPDSLEVIVYPAGTYVKGEEDVLTLDTVYDSVNLKRNDYVHLFMEQGILVANPCYEGRRITVPVAINGRTAANDITKNFGA